MPETIRFEVTDGLARLTLNRPDAMNAMTNRMVRETREVLERVAGDETVRVLLLTGEGRAFCPGADVKRFAAGSGDDDVRLTIRDFHIATLLHEMPTVTVAAINGACAGAGLGWALACDLRLMAAGARLNTAFLDVAVAGDMGIPWSLPRIVGAGRARELSFLPRRIEADEAKAIGLVARVFPEDSFRQEVETVVQTLLEKSPTALAGMKQNYVLAERATFSDFIDVESERHVRIFASDDTKEAFAAFVEKRKPKFF